MAGARATPGAEPPHMTPLVQTVHTLARDCEAIRIPSGEPVTLAAGTSVYLTQSLGGTFTVQAPALGGLFRIAGSDADALGLAPLAGTRRDAPRRPGPWTKRPCGTVCAPCTTPRFR